MNRRQVKAAIRCGKPFIIHMADGKSYPVEHEDYIASTNDPTVVIVTTNEGQSTVLPLLTMTGIGFKHSVGNPTH